MANPNFDKDRAARILLDAELIGDAQACAKYGIAIRTLQNYRARMKGSPELAQVCAEKKMLQDLNWAAEIPEMLQAGIAFLRRASEGADPTDPDVIHAIAGAVKIVAEVQTMRDVIDARLSQQNGSDGAENRSLAPAASTETIDVYPV